MAADGVRVLREVLLRVGTPVLPSRPYREKLVLLLDWDPDLHPRDETGKFSGDGGGGAGGADRPSVERDKRLNEEARQREAVKLEARAKEVAKIDAELRANDPKSTLEGKSPAEKSAAVVNTLQTGKVVASEPLGDESNANTSALVNFEATPEHPDGIQGVYKPEAGEAWGGSFSNRDISAYITNKDFSLADREATAFDISQALGIGFVPETVLREHMSGVDVDTSDRNDGYDEDYAQEEYGRYRENAQEKAMDAVGEQMGEKFGEAQGEHIQNIKDRADEVNELWNEAIKDYPDNPAGSDSMMREHPVLPIGSGTERFERRGPMDVIDPIEVLDKAGVDVDSSLNPRERDRVSAVLREYLDKGHTELGDVDEDAARDHLDYDNWREAHEDTENRLYESQIKSFDSWKQEQGYRSGGGSGEDKNPDAPHPGGGSVQFFVDGTTRSGRMNAEDGAKVAILDYVLGTMDRHGNNMLYKDGHPVLIDNGYSLPDTDEFQFRSVGVRAWKMDDTLAPPEVRASVLKSLQDTDWQALMDRHPGMNAQERDALEGRLANMKTALATERGLNQLWGKQQLMGDW